MPFGIKPPEKFEKKEGLLPFRVSAFDSLIEQKGVDRGSTVLLTGNCGTGKSTFAMQSVYNGLLKGEKAVYISFDEQIEKIKKYFGRGFGWDFERFERQNKLFLVRIDPFNIARSVEAFLAEKKGDLLISIEEIEFPFIPDRIVVDSLSALSTAFLGNFENYRYYVRYLFEMLEKYDSVNFVITETQSHPDSFSRAGIEEFLVDSVVVFYNLATGIGQERQRAVEIVKNRGSAHERRAVPFGIGKKGIEIFKNKETNLGHQGV